MNQYDAGSAYGLPIRFSKPGGNDCSPVSLRLALAHENIIIPAPDGYDNVMTPYGLTPIAEKMNSYDWQSPAQSSVRAGAQKANSYH